MATRLCANIGTQQDDLIEPIESFEITVTSDDSVVGGMATVYISDDDGEWLW